MQVVTIIMYLFCFHGNQVIHLIMSIFEFIIHVLCSCLPCTLLIFMQFPVANYFQNSKHLVNGINTEYMYIVHVYILFA